MVTFGVEQHVAKRKSASNDWFRQTNELPVTALILSRRDNVDAGGHLRNMPNGTGVILPFRSKPRRRHPGRRVDRVDPYVAEVFAPAAPFSAAEDAGEPLMTPVRDRARPARRFDTSGARPLIAAAVSRTATSLSRLSGTVDRALLLPLLIAGVLFLSLSIPRLRLLRNTFVYPPAIAVGMPQDTQIAPLLMDFALPGYSSRPDSGSADSQAVAPPENLKQFQSLRLETYTVKPGDSISSIAAHYGLNQDTLISFNDISDVRRIQVGATFQIPNKNGLRYKVRRGDSLSAISSSYNVSVNALLDANNLKSTVLSVGQELFIPGVRMNPFQLDLILGTAFQWPVKGATLTSPFGFRPDPFTGVRDFHNGIDLALYYGAPIHAAGNGTVKDVGYNSIYGNYVVIAHAANFQTLYGHMSKQLVKPGQRVTVGQTIGLMGSTGYSTGTHLHFTIYHNYKPVNPLKYLP